MINFRRKVTYRWDKLPYQCWIKLNEYQQVLEENLYIKPVQANEILLRQRKLFEIPKEHLAQQCRYCLKSGISMESLHYNATLLSWSKQTLENRVTLLREFGAEYLQAASVSNFYRIMDVSVTVFKAITGIPRATCMTKNLLRVIEEPPSGVTPLVIPGEDWSVKKLHSHVMKWYIQWKLRIPEEDIKRMKGTKGLKLKSFGIMREMYDILHNDVGITTEEIVKHNCLGSGSPKDLRRVLDDVNIFNGVDVKELVRVKPLLHKMDYENVKSLMDYLKQYGHDEKAILRYPKVLIMPRHHAATKLAKLKSTPELDVLKNSRKAVNLLVAYNTAEVRMNYLRYLNIKSATVRALTEERMNFERYVKTGLDRTKGREICEAFTKLLKMEPEIMHRTLKKHPYWRHIDLVRIQSSLDFLLERFAPEDLHDNLQLILYPREKIAEALDGLSKTSETSGESDRQPLPSKQILALCLYEIEREYHFSGDGIWGKEDSVPKKVMAAVNSYSESLSDESDCETAESDAADQTDC